MMDYATVLADELFKCSGRGFLGDEPPAEILDILRRLLYPATDSPAGASLESHPSIASPARCTIRNYCVRAPGHDGLCSRKDEYRSPSLAVAAGEPPDPETPTRAVREA